MKYVTLEQMLNQTHEKNVLKFKLKLIRYKNDGIIFYKEDMSSLKLDQPFELYYLLTKGTISYKNAFPMPLSYYQEFVQNNYSPDFLIDFYQFYYQTKKVPSKKFFQNLEVFESKKHVWFYRVS